MKREKTVKYMVECAFDSKHQFEKAFKIEEGSEEEVSDVETYCPYCDKMIMVKIKGRVYRSETMLRILERFKIE